MFITITSGSEVLIVITALLFWLYQRRYGGIHVY